MQINDLLNESSDEQVTGLVRGIQKWAEYLGAQIQEEAAEDIENQIESFGGVSNFRAALEKASQHFDGNFGSVLCNAYLDILDQYDDEEEEEDDPFPEGWLTRGEKARGVSPENSNRERDYRLIKNAFPDSPEARSRVDYLSAKNKFEDILQQFSEDLVKRGEYEDAFDARTIGPTVPHLTHIFRYDPDKPLTFSDRVKLIRKYLSKKPR